MCNSTTLTAERRSLWRSPDSAHGVTSVCSDSRPECHAPSTYAFHSPSASIPRGRDMSPREVVRLTVLRYWELAGVARRTGNRNPLTGTYVTGWAVRDVLHDGAWLPLASEDESVRRARAARGEPTPAYDRSLMAEFSHVIPSSAGGAFCACNLLPELGSRNANHADSIPILTPEARDLINGWPTYWRDHVASAASLRRLDFSDYDVYA